MAIKLEVKYGKKNANRIRFWNLFIKAGAVVIVFTAGGLGVNTILRDRVTEDSYQSESSQKESEAETVRQGSLIQDNSALNNSDKEETIGNSFKPDTPQESTNTLTSQIVQNDVSKKGIKQLDISQRNISDLSLYEAYTDLEVLNVEGNPISDVTVLAGMTNLKRLSIAQSSVSDISCLATLANLELFYFGETSISDISVLRNFTNLKEVNFWYCPVKSLSALSKLTSLEMIEMSYTQVTSLQPIMGLPNLKSVSMRGLRLSREEVAKFRRLHPKCEILYLDEINYID